MNEKTNPEDADPGLNERDRLTQTQGAPQPPPAEEDGQLDPTWTNTSMPDGNAPDTLAAGGETAAYGSELDRAAPPTPADKNNIPAPDEVVQPQPAGSQPEPIE